MIEYLAIGFFLYLIPGFIITMVLGGGALYEDLGQELLFFILFWPFLLYVLYKELKQMRSESNYLSKSVT